MRAPRPVAPPQPPPNGGPAFPLPLLIDGGASVVPGMSLRAFIATAALQGWLANSHTGEDVDGIDVGADPRGKNDWAGHLRQVARSSCDYADALIAELGRGR